MQNSDLPQTEKLRFSRGTINFSTTTHNLRSGLWFMDQKLGFWSIPWMLPNPQIKIYRPQASHQPRNFNASRQFAHLLRHQFLRLMPRFVDCSNDEIFEHFDIIRINHLR